MRNVRFILPAAAASLTLLISPASSAADENLWGRCPDGYTPVPFLAAPDDDKNGNGVVCIKPVGSHDNIKDDPNGKKYRCNGFPTPPPQCINAESVLIRDDLL